MYYDSEMLMVGGPFDGQNHAVSNKYAVIVGPDTWHGRYVRKRLSAKVEAFVFVPDETVEPKPAHSWVKPKRIAVWG